MQIVIDTNVLYAGLRSRNGASHILLRNIPNTKFDINVSVPVVVEYEDVLKRNLGAVVFSTEEVDEIIDLICYYARKHEVHFLWRPYLRDPKDDMMLELALKSKSEVIVTFNTKDFVGIDVFNIKVMTPKEFLTYIGILL